jgi:hypothetical protein
LVVSRVNASSISCDNDSTRFSQESAATDAIQTASSSASSVIILAVDTVSGLKTKDNINTFATTLSFYF